MLPLEVVWTAEHSQLYQLLSTGRTLQVGHIGTSTDMTDMCVSLVSRVSLLCLTPPAPSARPVWRDSSRSCMDR